VSRLGVRLRAVLRRDELWLFAAFVLVYWLTAGVLLTEPSVAPYYAYLAESFLQGHAYLVTPPPTTYDLMFFEGHAYIPGGPLPTLAFLPIVALRGAPVGFPDAVLTSAWGALNVVLVYTVLRRLARQVEVPRAARLALAVVFGAGTSHWYVASMGNVWSTAHVCAVTFMCLYAVEVLGRNRPALAGLWLGLAGLSRPPCWFAFPFFVVLTLAGGKGREGGRRAAGKVLAFGSVMAACVGLTLLYNYARFGSPLDFGYSYVAGSEQLVELQRLYGSFNLHFAGRNLSHMVWGLPDVSCEAGFELQANPAGMSIFLVTPPLLYLFKSVQRRPLKQWARLVRHAFRRCSGAVRFRVAARLFRLTPLVAAGWLTVSSVTIPLALYHNTGAYQFGYRYTLDWLPIGLVLVAIGMRGRVRGWGWVLIGAAVLINLAGTLWIYPEANMQGQEWTVFWSGAARSVWDSLQGLVQ
jgi:hypothetical protein